MNFFKKMKKQICLLIEWKKYLTKYLDIIFVQKKITETKQKININYT